MKTFYFKHMNHGDDFHPIKGFDAEDAAQNFAKRENQESDYYLMNSTDKVFIADNEEGKDAKEFLIGAEPDVHYWSCLSDERLA